MNLLACTPTPETDSPAGRLLQFNRHLLDQALLLVAMHELPGTPAYADRTGPHLRHVIEHYEALVLRADGAAVDYDRRARDRELERTPTLAQARLHALQLQLTDWPEQALEQPLWVKTQGGALGEFEVATRSSVGRELVFLASHTAHHFAVLQAYCEQLGLCAPAEL
eukprot:gene3478-4967_t